MGTVHGNGMKHEIIGRANVIKSDSADTLKMIIAFSGALTRNLKYLDPSLDLQFFTVLKIQVKKVFDEVSQCRQASYCNIFFPIISYQIEHPSNDSFFMTLNPSIKVNFGYVKYPTLSN